MGLLEGKVVLITGGTSGIGRAAAAAFADAAFSQADVSLAADVERLMASTVARHGRLDAAFNNAATADGALALTARASFHCSASGVPMRQPKRLSGCALTRRHT